MLTKMSNVGITTKDDKSNLYESANAFHSMCIHVLRRARESDKKTGLTPERLSILSILAFAGSKTIGQLAKLEQVTAPAISRIIKALVELNLVVRARDKHDTRVVYVQVTNKGKDIIESARRDRIANIAAEIEVLSPEQILLLKEVAVKLL